MGGGVRGDRGVIGVIGVIGVRGVRAVCPMSIGGDGRGVSPKTRITISSPLIAPTILLSNPSNLMYEPV